MYKKSGFHNGDRTGTQKNYCMWWFIQLAVCYHFVFDYMQFSGTVCIGLALYWHCMYWYNLQCANIVCNGLTCIALYVLFSIVCQYCMYWADLQCANNVYI